MASTFRCCLMAPNMSACSTTEKIQERCKFPRDMQAIQSFNSIEGSIQTLSSQKLDIKSVGDKYGSFNFLY
jgi:hypothetical protein